MSGSQTRKLRRQQEREEAKKKRNSDFNEVYRRINEVAFNSVKNLAYCEGLSQMLIKKGVVTQEEYNENMVEALRKFNLIVENPVEEQSEAEKPETKKVEAEVSTVSSDSPEIETHKETVEVLADDSVATSGYITEVDSEGKPVGASERPFETTAVTTEV